MLFNSYSFLIFFILVLAISRSLGSWRVRKSFLLASSYLFYAAWNPPFVILLWISTVIDWFAGRAIFRTQTKWNRRAFLLISLLVNLGMLSYFKYGGFLLENFKIMMGAIGLHLEFADPSIILPVGISFYTFQTLSYTIDIYKGKLKPWHSFLDYALYVTFFPQLVAGPIVRASEFLPQCNEPKTGSRNQIAWGLSLFVVGLFAKVVIADAFAAPVVVAVYGSAVAPGFFSAWTGTLAFAIQIFCDFFGYSTCAIGVALCLGFELHDNFRYPYAARGFSDFWQRWHISLSSWLRDYLYIALGGNRKGAVRTYVNLMVTMLLGGLWHGASWMFVIWGGLHGGYLVAERLLVQLPLARWSVWSSKIGQGFLALVTFGLVNVTWVFFRALDLSQAMAISSSMLDPRRALASLAAKRESDSAFSAIEAVGLERADYLTILVLTVFILWIHQALRDSNLEDTLGRLNWGLRAMILAVLAFCIIISMAGEDNAFIYFQF